jgi:hypothetical protein
MTQQNVALVYYALYNKDRHPLHLDDAFEAVDGAREEYRKGKADFYIEKAERLRGILAIKGQP